MRAGRLRHRIDIQDRTFTQDRNTGEMVPGPWVTTWEDCPAEIKPLSTRDFVQAQAAQAEITARIVIRYRPGVTSSMRAVHGETIYTLTGPPLADDGSGREYLTLMVSAGVRDG
ncbi:phage head closure protein [Pseudomonas syringae group genomosp. 3]|uniref:Phage head-tail adaptor n=1 Tax=Pseudomonas syringae pv. persicae TaxID=237306 RepID=A0AB38EBB6_9PSED|nr:phage head closure protein [Pseudomonas syringae group genomosp. 3]SOQ06547.1 phage head-tail adaptor [Pseudomonas syringae pv. persicae]SOQ06832.1 phage head-tail adaptor [Pseudomonas syringae pv. persicae]